ncbi:SDR family oxidoreductase [Pseudobacteriovorax antillogorgiicola]|uniref:SDR family oxidoreductase n=1 Tax=Pseudobacteriovorax antillogorgiicola TaxID=1513793 RepID=UPI00135671EC|nr:NAD(P)H-binding protein [Pseudobacteriovorax antillogorgiicola]
MTRTDSAEDAILVAGGSGFIGRHLVPFLADRGHSVVSMYHMRLPEPYPNVFPVCSDLGSVDLLAAPLRGVETVIFLAWENNFMGSSDEIKFDPSYKRCSTNVRLLSNLLTAMEKAETKRIIFLSAVGANRRAKLPFLKEKYLAEVAVLNSKVPEKIIVRSNLVYHPDSAHDQFIKSVMNVMKFPGVYPVPRVDDKIAPVHIDDLCQILGDASEYEMEQPSAIVEVAGPDDLRVEDIFRLVSEKFSKGARIQLRGSLGNSLVPIFERRGEHYSPSGPKVKDYLSIANIRDSNTETDNPISGVLLKKTRGFREALGAISK